ncbi:MerR family transcriptional regulator [Listeria innocua]|uniref:MerR family transcriptional regulator n=1 Tax=Listeria innocua TaxID=1642 RepID=UPI00162AAC1D|nr:MerR family transcriptional regulator [Listeria innocua]MBC2132039.1 MerR family transcriptional regulator [Listeria innocua]
MEESEMDKVRKMNVAEIRQLQNDVIANIESNYDNLSRSELIELQNDLKFLEGVRDSKRGITAVSKLLDLTVEEYKELSKSNSDKSIACELGVSRSAFADWKRKKNLVPWNNNARGK